LDSKEPKGPNRGHLRSTKPRKRVSQIEAGGDPRPLRNQRHYILPDKIKRVA